MPLDTIAIIPLLILNAVIPDDYTSFNYYRHLDSIGRKIMEKVNSSQNVTYYPKENSPSCKSGQYIYYGFVTYPDFFDSSDFVICTYNLWSQFGQEEFEYEVNATVRHEAVHSAQFCKGGNRLLGVDKWKFEGYPNNMVYAPNSSYRNLPHDKKIMELEAFALESEPYIVLRNLERFCF